MLSNRRTKQRYDQFGREVRAKKPSDTAPATVSTMGFLKRQEPLIDPAIFNTLQAVAPFVLGAMGFGLLSKGVMAVGTVALSFLTGQAPGGADRCHGYVADCLQGHVVNSTTSEVVLDWDRVVNTIGDTDLFDLATKRAFKACVNPEKMKEVITRALAAGDVQEGNTCALSSSIWAELQAVGAIRGLDPAACAQAQNAFPDVVRACQSYGGLTTGGYVGIGVGALAVLAVVIGVVVACSRHHNGLSMRPGCGV